MFDQERGYKALQNYCCLYIGVVKASDNEDLTIKWQNAKKYKQL